MTTLIYVMMRLALEKHYYHQEIRPYNVMDKIQSCGLLDLDYRSESPTFTGTLRAA